MNQSEGYFVWLEPQQTYVKATKNLEVIQPIEELRLSEVNTEAVVTILQLIWCKKTGWMNHQIGAHREQDKQIAKELGIW
uniref:hypothetical protein n=1 Tax=Candidatus Enterococcus willemsii TaxID=1857215 RepID=UPI00403F5861